MNKGIVMDINDGELIVLRADGIFDRIPRRDRACQVGEEIVYVLPRRRMNTIYGTMSGVAAAAVLCLILFYGLLGAGGKAESQVVAYVSMDINPSVEMAIDENEHVLDLKGLNSDGQALIASIAYKGKPLSDITEEILNLAEKGALSKGDGDIIIASTVVNTKSSVNDIVLASKLQQQVNKHIKEKHAAEETNYNVTSFATPQEIRDAAETNNVSMGKYAMYLNAKNLGDDVSLDMLQKQSVHTLAKSYTGLKSVLETKKVSKNELQKLYDEEKTGALDEKFKQIVEDRKNTNDDKKATPKPTVKPTPTPKATDKSRNGDSKNKDKSTAKPSPTPSVKPTPRPSGDPNKDSNNNNHDNNPDNKKDGTKESSTPVPSPSVKPSPSPTSKLGE
jgi:hypothetical protein